jgi:hypothetical protein
MANGSSLVECVLHIQEVPSLSRLFLCIVTLDTTYKACNIFTVYIYSILPLDSDWSLYQILGWKLESVGRNLLLKVVQGHLGSKRGGCLHFVMYLQMVHKASIHVNLLGPLP